MSSGVPFAAKATWLAVYTEPSLDKLQDHLQVLPTLFRVLAALCFLPVAALAFADVIGWAFFKLVLRPLGYASTIRFKDPEPPAFLSDLPGRDASLPSSSSSSEASNSPISSPASATMSLPAIEETRRPRPASKSRSKTRKASISSASEGEMVYSTKSMNRHRAPSVGFDGPLFGEDTTDGEAQTPGCESDSGGSGFFRTHVNLGPPPVGPRRTSSLQPSLSFTKAKDE
ncbi:uncharacterized protein JCM15063_000956 [Sporobolomyces koalae]|uniref:uncharacterized protein n=1 Tax=Sporobolomyces koalae TaxID=500713 RepID=UPI00316E1D8B